MRKAGILIVEDSFIVALHLQTTLEAEGYRVLATCEAGERALEFVQEVRPDLVLMDIMLAGTMDGIQTAGILKSEYDIPVIYITALTDKQTIGRAKITEPYGYLSKPFEDREIFAVIEMALYKHNIEFRLRQSEEKYFSTVNSITDAVVSIDREYKISFMNPTAIAMTRWTLKDAMGQPVSNVIRLRDDSTQEVNLNPIQCPLGKGNLNQMPDGLILTGKNGTEVPIGESSLSLLLDNKSEFIGLIMVFRDMTEKNEHQRLIRQIDQSRLAALIEGGEKERNRISKDLHDGLGQMLNAIKINIDVSVADKDVSSRLSKLLDEAITETTRISENLLPAKLKDFDLAVCLRSLFASIKETTQTTILFDAHGDEFSMGQFQKINFYRIAQEAVNNAIKHAAATVINVQLNRGHDSLRLSVEDNGKGLNGFQKNESGLRQPNGLVNMKERADAVGGKFTIESDQHRGTMVIVEVPLSKLSENEEI